jgi:hypothetical protein
MDRYLTRFARELEKSTRVIECHFITCCINIYAVFEKSYFKWGLKQIENEKIQKVEDLHTIEFSCQKSCQK